MPTTRQPLLASFARLARAVTLGTLLAALLVPTAARADVAPPAFPQGGVVQPGSETTQVRMEAEQVRLDVFNLPAGNEAGRAAVTADFQMQNEGSAAESMAVRFPLSVLNGWGDGFGNYPEIKDLLVWVNGQRVDTTRVTSPNPSQVNDPPLAWAAFDVTFPPGKSVPIKVTYTAEGIGEHPDVGFSYVLETGAGWKGTIGQADLTVHLPYPANDLNVIVPMSTPGLTMDGNDLHWRLADLEPQPGQNLGVELMMTGVWQTILTERQNVTANPKDGEAWGRLGKVLKESLQRHHDWRSDPGGQEIYQEALAAYEKAVTLLPKDALWHYGFADLLINHFRTITFYTEDQDVDTFVRAVQEIKTSLDLDPNNQNARSLAGWLEDMIPGSIVTQDGRYSYPALTATPAITPFPTEIPYSSDTPEITPTETATSTPVPPVTDTATPVPTKKPTAVHIQGQAGASAGTLAKQPALPICGAGLILPLAIIVGGIGIHKWLK
jgi:hypothetical protein